MEGVQQPTEESATSAQLAGLLGQLGGFNPLGLLPTINPNTPLFGGTSVLPGLAPIPASQSLFSAAPLQNTITQPLGGGISATLAGFAANAGLPAQNFEAMVRTLSTNETLRSFAAQALQV